MREPGAAMEPRSGPWAVCDAAWGVRDSGLLLPQDSDWPTEAACLLGKPITPSLPLRPVSSPRGPKLRPCPTQDRLGLQQMPPRCPIHKHRVTQKG